MRIYFLLFLRLFEKNWSLIVQYPQKLTLLGSSWVLQVGNQKPGKKIWLYLVLASYQSP